ncbi:hypothetical protein JCM14076_01900 [Methylosoma difficile]
MALTIQFEENNLFVVRSSGVLDRPDADAIKKEVVSFMKRHGRAIGLIIIEDGFLNVSKFASWDDDEDDEYIQKHLDRLAIVGDLRWRDSALLFFLNGFVPFSIEFFKTDQEAFARAWLKN